MGVFMEKVAKVDLEIREFRKLLVDVINGKGTLSIRDGISSYQALFWFIFSQGYNLWFVALLKQEKPEWAGDPLTKEQKLTLLDKLNLLERKALISNGLLAVYEKTIDEVFDIHRNIVIGPFQKKLFDWFNKAVPFIQGIIVIGCVFLRPTILPIAIVIWLMVGDWMERLAGGILEVAGLQLKQAGTIEQCDLIIKNVNQKNIKNNTLKCVKILTSLGLVDKKYFRLNWFEENWDSKEWW